MFFSGVWGNSHVPNEQIFGALPSFIYLFICETLASFDVASNSRSVAVALAVAFVSSGAVQCRPVWNLGLQVSSYFIFTPELPGPPKEGLVSGPAHESVVGSSSSRALHPGSRPVETWPVGSRP